MTESSVNSPSGTEMIMTVESPEGCHYMRAEAGPHLQAQLDRIEKMLAMIIHLANRASAPPGSS